MGDINEIINHILDEMKNKNSKNFDDKVYADEPIIFSAAKMSGYLPEKYREMRKIAQEADYYTESEASIFYNQAKFMEDFEDDFDYNGRYMRPFPTYQTMNDEALRGYFSWRTKLRRGDFKKTNISFAFLYCYELINGIGFENPEDGYKILCDFCRSYSSIDTKFFNYYTNWLNDFIVYYNLNQELLSDVSDSYFDECLAIISKPENVPDSQLFGALHSLSSYRFEKSKAYKSAPQDMEFITCCLFREICKYYNENRQKTYVESIFGKVMSGPYIIFKAAVFHDQKKYADYTYKVNDLLKYTCRDGRWSKDHFFGSRTPNKELGVLFKNVDAAMRQRLGIKPQLKNVVEKPIISDFLASAFARLDNKKKKDRLNLVNIDLSKLSGIRKAAAVTMDKLIVDDDFLNAEPKDDEMTPNKESNIQSPDDFKVVEPINNTPLNDDEFYLICRIIKGEDYAIHLRNKGLMPTVLIDGINEKLFDEFGDTVIDFDGDRPYIIEDYLEDLKGMLF